jgi:hypothetical protein
MPEPSALTSVTEPRRTASAMPGVPICEAALSSSGSTKAASIRRHSTLTGFRPDTVRTISRPSETVRSSPSKSMVPR